MIPYDDSNDMLVEIDLMERKLGVPLYQLEPTVVDDETRQAIEDWQYWVARGYEFG